MIRNDTRASGRRTTPKPGSHLASRLLHYLRIISPVEAHNRLMASPDRDIALGMMYMNDDERNEILARLAPAKASRVVEEVRLQERLQIRQDHYETAVSNLLSRISGTGKPSFSGSYIRPRRTSADD